MDKDTININQLIRRTNLKKKKIKRSNSNHPFNNSKYSQNKGNYVNDDHLINGFGSQVVPSSKLKNSLIRTGMRNSDYGKGLHNDIENNYGKI